MPKQQPEKKKMATSREVYDRIIWDMRLDSSAFTIGFQERLSNSGVREKPLLQWATDGDIPWHRIRYIRCQDVVVWNRDEHLDLVSSGNLPAAAWKREDSQEVEDNTVTLTLENTPPFNPRPIYGYSRQGWQIVEPNFESVNLDALTIASFNVLCDLHEAEKIHTAQRLPAIVEHLHKCNADIIALQEATPVLLELLLSQDWVGDYFICESPAAETIQPYGNLILSRIPFTLVEHKFSAHKRLLVGSWLINNESLQVGVVHLTSELAKNAFEIRKKQLSALLGYLQTQAGTSLIVGDFNSRSNEQEDILSSCGFVDVWKSLHPYEAGYTFDPQRNPLAAIMSMRGEAARFDRIMLRGITPQSIELFACKPVENTEDIIYPSDHFGIRAVVNLSTKTSVIKNNNSLDTIRPVYKSAIVIIPPENILPPIQSIRSLYDARFERWMPHINLLYGFLPEEYFEQALEIIAPALAKLQPFTITLESFDTFTHRKNCTAWLRPVAEPQTALHNLQSQLYQLFPQCDEQSSKSKAGFTPHLSVGQFPIVEEALMKLPQWQPVSFTVNSIALISRRGDEPFEVRYVVPLGQVETDASLLKLKINKLQPELTPAQRSQRETILEIIKQACRESLGFEASLHLLGSAALGVESSQSDLDVVCVIPNYITGSAFLQSIEQRLEGLCDGSHVVLDAKVAALRLKIEGISVDLLYARLEEINDNPKSKIKNLKSHIDSISLKAIIGCWEADLIIETVKQHVPLELFKLLLRAVRGWAKARKIYGNSWGFLGGFSWALLSAWICTYVSTRDITLEVLLANFFQVIQQHNWSQVVALTDVGREFEVKLPQDWLPIITSIEPCQNTARNVTRSTAEIFKREIARGAKITESILAGKLADAALVEELFAEVNLEAESDVFLVITASCEDKESLRRVCGILEGYFIGLVIQLEQQLNIFVRPDIGVKIKGFTASVVLGLSLSDDSDLNKIKELANNFVSQLNSGDFVRSVGFIPH